jgi:hypothetical protein
MAHSLTVLAGKFIAHFIIKAKPQQPPRQLPQQPVRRDDLTRAGAAPVSPHIANPVETSSKIAFANAGEQYARSPLKGLPETPLSRDGGRK